jgi:hypothetical protein
VVWTSTEVPSNAIQLYQGDRLAAEIRVPAQGLAGDTQAPLYVDGQVALLSTGNVKYDQTNIVALDPKTCRVELTKVDRPGVLNLAARDGGYITNNILDSVSQLRSVTASGQPTGAADYPQASLDVTVVHQGKLYSHLVDDSSGQSEIVVSDPVTLAEISRHGIAQAPANATAWSMAVAAGKLWLPVTMDAAEQPDSRLAVVDLATMESHLVDLGAPLPFQVVAAGGLVYVAHTFMNPAFGALADFRHVSVVDPAAETATGHDLPAAANHIAVTADRLIALGEDPGGGFLLHSYALPSFEPVDQFALAPPAWMPDAYAIAAIHPTP